MKYIRTKDGVFKVIKNDHPFYTQVEMKYTPGVMMHESVIEKSADTIEELCDAIIRFKDGKLPLVINYRYDENRVFLSALEECKKEYKDLYLGVYTQKGLIYVAKMNEKGEFDLL